MHKSKQRYKNIGLGIYRDVKLWKYILKNPLTQYFSTSNSTLNIITINSHKKSKPTTWNNFYVGDIEEVVGGSGVQELWNCDAYSMIAS